MILKLNTFHGSPSISTVRPFLISDVSMATPREVGTRDAVNALLGRETVGAKPEAPAAIVAAKTANREKRAILSGICYDRRLATSKLKSAIFVPTSVMGVVPTTQHIGDPDADFPSY